VNEQINEYINDGTKVELIIGLLKFTDKYIAKRRPTKTVPYVSSKQRWSI